MSDRYGSEKRREIAKVLDAYRLGYMTDIDALDAIELELADAAPQADDSAAKLVVMAVSTLLVGLDKRSARDAVQVGQSLADELQAAGILRGLG